MEVPQEVWDRIVALEKQVEELKMTNAIAVSGRGMRAFFGNLKEKLATYGIHLDGVHTLAPANETPEAQGSGSERYAAGTTWPEVGDGTTAP